MIFFYQLLKGFFGCEQFIWLIQNEKSDIFRKRNVIATI